MSKQRTYSLKDEVIERFEKTVGIGERSTIVNNLIEEYTRIQNPDKKAQKAERERLRKEAEEQLNKLMQIDQAEADKALIEREAREKALIIKVRSEEASHFKDNCKKKAKVITNIKFGLDPLTDFLPKDFKKKKEYMVFWKELTDKYILEGNEKKEQDTV
jgi:hypothetical protein